ncbi:MAG TPA: DUF998 domain-containing protein [Pseudoxanthomonas sp.]|nr:DUF998 domain-containing protein [Pseudoxanthomonas sp.]
MSRTMPSAGIAALAVWAVAVVGFGAALNGFSQLMHPVSVLGAKDIPRALAFNLIGFVVPGLLAGVVAIDLRRRMPASSGWRARIGTQLVFMSALAFIALGLLPLDVRELESPASRLHGTAWMLWSIAFVPGALLLGLGLRNGGTRSFAHLTLAAAAAVLVSAFALGEAVPAGLAQRIAFLAWFAWLAMAGRARW